MSTPGIARAVAVGLVAVLVACGPRTPPAPVAGPPKFPDYPALDVPAGLKVAPTLQALHDTAWLRLQSGDLRGAARDYQRVLKTAPEFYPSQAGLGFAALADREFKDAAANFAAVIASNERYLPAWQGQADAALGLGNDELAISSLERVLALDPKRETARSRLELVRFRQLQALIEQGRRARSAARYDESRSRLQQALAMSPASTAILSELLATERAAGALEEAEKYARQIVAAAPNDADAHAQLGALLESQNRFREAASSFARAASLAPNAEWTARVAALREKANLAALPPEFATLESSPAITRGQAAAFIGVKLDTVIEAAPKRAAVATDIRGHWASPWIIPVAQAGVMDVYPNHTFQPGSAIRRNDLAQIVSRLLPLVAASQPQELARWRAARPRLIDLPATNVFYRAAALAVASGAMKADADGRFASTRQVTGAELAEAVTRLQQLSGR